MSLRHFNPLPIRHRDAITRLRQRQLKRRTGLTDRAVRAIDREWLSTSIQIAHELGAICCLDMASNRNAFANPVCGHKQPLFVAFACREEVEVLEIAGTGKRPRLSKEGGESCRRAPDGLGNQSVVLQPFIDSQRHLLLLQLFQEGGEVCGQFRIGQHGGRRGRDIHVQTLLGLSKHAVHDVFQNRRTGRNG